jgi:hypothetical protein
MYVVSICLVLAMYSLRVVRVGHEGVEVGYQIAEWRGGGATGDGMFPHTVCGEQRLFLRGGMKCFAEVWSGEVVVVCSLKGAWP